MVSEKKARPKEYILYVSLYMIEHFPSTPDVAFMYYFRVINFCLIEFYMLLRLIYEDIAFISEYIRIILLKVNVLNCFLLTGVRCSDLRLHLEYRIKSFSLVCTVSLKYIAALNYSSMKHFKLQA